jgi:hypothetical protein
MKKEVKVKKKILGTKKFNPEKYIEINPRLSNSNSTFNESKSKTVVLSFGRFSPPTNGHELLVNKVRSLAKQRGADAHIYMSHSHDRKKNPLSYQDKYSFMKYAFGSIVKKSPARTIIEVVKTLNTKYENLVVVVGQDRIAEFERLLNAYNGKEYEFKSIEVVSAGARDPDADDVTGMSASKMRSLAAAGKFNEFKAGLPRKLQTRAKSVYDSVLEGMEIMSEEHLYEEILDENTPLSLMQRRRRGMIMRKNRNRLRIARERAKKRKATPEKLKKRAQRKALNFIRQRLSKQKKYSEMSPSEKIALDRRLTRIPKSMINRIATRELPKVRQAEVKRLSSLHKKKNEDVNDLFEGFMDESTKRFPKLFSRDGKVNFDKRFKVFRKKMNESEEDMLNDLDDLMESTENYIDSKKKLNKNDPKNREYGTDSLVRILKSDTPGENVVSENNEYHAGLAKSTAEKRKAHFNKGAEKDPSDPSAYKPAPGDARAKTKPSVHTKRFKAIYGEDMNLEESIEETIRKKAEKTGISYGILKKVYDRGVAAWRTGHRPGTTPSQWGVARINSFATGGKTRQTTDADLWKQHTSKNEEYSSDLESLNENVTQDKIIAAIHKHVLRGKDPMDVAWDIVNMTGIDISAHKLYNAYMNKHGQKISNSSKAAAALRSKYGFKTEGKARGFEGEMIDVPNVPIRTIDGKIKSFPSGKSSSSKGGNGD